MLLRNIVSPNEMLNTVRYRSLGRFAALLLRTTDHATTYTDEGIS
jgi:hypothetical protein